MAESRLRRRSRRLQGSALAVGGGSSRRIRLLPDPAWRARHERALVRVAAGLVQDGRLLRAPHPGVLRLVRRRYGGLPRPAAEARLPPVARDRLHLAPAVLPLAAPRRRLRRRGLPL